MQSRETTDRILQNIAKVMVGKENTALFLLTAMLSDGHVLLEDVPGTGKTKLAKTLAREFVLRRGPVFTNILLADEINRATPRTQAGLLECMEEHQVTIDGVSYPLPSPFLVVATQNPLETAGTFPLPEAQMDRFAMKLSMGLPNERKSYRFWSVIWKKNRSQTYNLYSP